MTTAGWYIIAQKWKNLYFKQIEISNELEEEIKSIDNQYKDGILEAALFYGNLDEVRK